MKNKDLEEISKDVNNMDFGDRVTYYQGAGTIDVDIRNFVGFLNDNGTHVNNIKRMTNYPSHIPNKYEYTITKLRKPSFVRG